MIVRMKHLDLVCIAADKEATLERLRAFGAVHLDLGAATGAAVASAKGEIESLRADIASVRREMGRMREEITRDLTKKIVDISKTMRPSPPPQDRAPVYTGAVKEYRVIKGDTLSLIAQAFGTTVQKLREINSLKTDVLQVGQRILVPRN